MKRPILISCLSLVALAGCAETPPPRANLMPPAPAQPPVEATAPAADPAPVTDGDVTVSWVNGIQVIVERMPGAAFAAGQLYVRGGTRNWTAQNAGIEQLAFRVAASGGTKSLEKTAFSRKLAALGATIYGDAGNDFSSLAMKAPREAWDDTFGLLADVFLHPALPASEIELARTQSLAQLHHEQEDPEGQLWTVLRQQLFAGHPYLNRPIGTIESVTALQAADLGPYLDKLRETGRLVFIAAGDIDAAHVTDQVRAAFGGLPRGSYVDSPLPPIAFDAPHFVTKERKLPTNYCETAFPAPRWTDPDFVTGLVTISGYSWRLWQEVRTKRNLTYAVGAYIQQSLATPFGLMTVSAVDPNAAMKVMLDEARRLRDQPMPDDELAGFKAEYLTGYMRTHELPDWQVYSIGEAQLYGGDWHLARTLPDKVRAITSADVQAYARKYFGHLQAAVVGDPTKVDQALFTTF
jgi:predicted Zn-dependent peptidase